MMEGIWSNLTNIDTAKWEEFILNVPIEMFQYNTKYNKKKILRDPKKLTITFQNNYSKNSKEREVVFDFSEYIDKIINYPRADKLKILFETGIPGTKDPRVEWHFTKDNDKPKVISIQLYDGETWRTKPVLVAKRYVEDYRPGYIPSTDEYMKSWTITTNKL